MTERATLAESLGRAMAENAGFCWDHCAQSQWSSDALAAIEKLGEIGYVIAPKQPTGAMVAAAWRAHGECPDKDADIMEPIYHAMIEAAGPLGEHMRTEEK